MSEAKTAVKTEAASKERVFALSTLRKNSMKLFGVTTSTFDGAMTGQTGPLTVNAAKGMIEKWKKGAAH